MWLNVALLELTKNRILTRFWIRRCHQKRPDVLLELLIDQGIVLIVSDTKQVLLRRCRELQANCRIGNRADISLNQSAHRLLDSGSSKRLRACGVPNHRLHQWPSHLVRMPLCKPLEIDPPQHPDVRVCIQIYFRRTP